MTTALETFFDTLGLVGSFLVAAALVPQMWKVYKTKSAKDISTSFQVVFATGVALILTYGLGESLWPIWIPALLELAAGLILIVLKLYYDWCDRKRELQEEEEALAAVAAEGASPSASTSGLLNYNGVLTPRS